MAERTDGRGVAGAVRVNFTETRMKNLNTAGGQQSKIESQSLVTSAATSSKPHFVIRNQGAFTLVEMLTVIAIIAILAGLILGGAGIATVKSRTSKVKGERSALVTAIEAYKNKKGFYPPDNPNSPYINPLLYELTGTTNDGVKFYAITGESFTTNDLQVIFGINGFLNSSSDTNEPPINFLKVSLNSRITSITKPQGGQGTFSLLGVNVPPGLPSGITAGGGNPLTLWNYVSSHPTNNSSEFDLWMDVTWRGTTNRISNWAEDPQPQ